LILGDSEGQEGAFVSPEFGNSFLEAMVKDSRTDSCAVQQCIRVIAYEDQEEKPTVHEEFRRVQPTRCNVSQFIYFCKTLYMFQTGFPSIIRSSKLHIQRQTNTATCCWPGREGTSRPGKNPLLERYRDRGCAGLQDSRHREIGKGKTEKYHNTTSRKFTGLFKTI